MPGPVATVQQPRMARVDTLELRDKLHASVGPVRWQTYWKALSNFLHARISRAEFEEVGLSLLQPDEGTQFSPSFLFSSSKIFCTPLASYRT